VATHFSRLLRHAWVTVGLFLFPGHRTGNRWVYNIKIGLKETGCEDMEWIHLAQNSDKWRTVVNTVMKLGVSYKCGKFRD